ncbi:MAG TPA: zinc-binding alcohol dehydrogenase [Methylocystis sp.]|nr:zinc-binding alcohol dehydrogenase [Methylocystis sp.]
MTETAKSRHSSSKGTRALWIDAPGVAALRSAKLDEPGRGEALVKTLYSAISRGTERLVFQGRVPASEAASMRAPFQEGDFSFPLKYGYCAVGRVEAGPPEWRDRLVFCLHPHQDRFIAPLEALRGVPQATPARRAALAANMETALNAVWDSGAGPGDRIVVIGAGVVGLLVATLAAHLPGAEVAVVDVEPSRAEVAENLGARFVLARDFAPRADADVVFHASAAATGLALAISSAGAEAKIVELSWYGDAEIATPLGGAFHARRLQLISSQVGQVSPSRRPRWTHARRLDKALELLTDARLDALITEEVAFGDLPRELARILAPGAKGLATLVRY